jgi:hypothetical protein
MRKTSQTLIPKLEVLVRAIIQEINKVHTNRKGENKTIPMYSFLIRRI